MTSSIAPPAVAIERARPGLARRRRRDAIIGLAYAAPATVVIVVLFLVPLILAFWMSLNDWPLIGDPAFNAPDNYVAIADNQLFLNSIVFTVTYTIVMTIIFLVVGLALALLVQNARPGVGFFRTAFLLPTAVGLASSSLLFYAFYNNDFGFLDDVLRAVGLVEGQADFLGTPENAFVSTVVMVTWRFAGFNMIILLTGLQAIPVEVYEAARTDGAGWWKTLWFVTIPLLKPTIILILVLAITGSLLAFEPFYVLTAGGPSNSTVTMVIAMFRQAFTLFDLGGAAAIAIVLLVALVAVNVAQMYLFREKEARK